MKWALELKTYLDRGVAFEFEGETILDTAKDSDRAVITMEIAELLDGVDLDL